MSHPAYPNALSVQAVGERLREATASALHEFWADEATLLATIADIARRKTAADD